jgi:hypothetical protein
MTSMRLRIGKIRSSRPVYPSEPGFIQSVNAQLKDLQFAIQSIADQMGEVSPFIAQEAWAPTFAKARAWCPRKTGALVGSGYLEITSFSKSSPHVEMGFGRGGDPPYTVYVHEQVNHYHAPPTRAKWLQAAVLEDIGVLWSRLQAGYRAFMG